MGLKLKKKYGYESEISDEVTMPQIFDLHVKKEE